MFYGKEMKHEKKNYMFFGIIGLIAIGLFIAASTTDSSVGNATSNQQRSYSATAANITESDSTQIDRAVTQRDTIPEFPEATDGEATYVVVTNACNHNFAGPEDCLNIRSGPGTEYPIVGRLREDMVLQVNKAVDKETNDWYKIVYDQKLYYPERVSTDQYVAAGFVDIFTASKPITEWEDGAINDTDKRIEVDLSEQKLYAYEGDDLFLETTVSTGEEFSPTTIGEYEVFKKMPTRYMQGPIPGSGLTDEYDLAGVPWNLYFSYDGMVIHGAYWHDEFGDTESHGCVNLRPEQAKELYDWTVLGTPVTVVD